LRFIAPENIIQRVPQFFLFFLASLLLQIIFVTTVGGWDMPFNNAANCGGTGLMETPTARVLEDGEIRFGYAQADPYRWYTGAMGVFPGLEVSGTFTELTNVESGMAGYGNYKDKSFNLKYQILPESKKFPAIAVGLNDFHGTQLFPAQYIAFSRQIFPFDFTIGIGRERLSGGISPPLWDRVGFLDELGLFGGIEWALHERLHLMAEYNPIEYENDIGAPGRAVPEKARWPVNIGARIRVLSGVDLGISYQRGDTLGFMIHLHTKLGEPVLPQRPDPPLRHSVDRRPFSKRDTKEMVEKIYAAISETGLSNIVVYTNGIDLTAEFANGRYLSDQKAVGRVLGILLFYSPLRGLCKARASRKIPVRQDTGRYFFQTPQRKDCDCGSGFEKGSVLENRKRKAGLWLGHKTGF
jgi:hypothetical protein